MRNEFTVSWGSQKQTMMLPGSIKNLEKEVIMMTTLPEKTEYSVNSILLYSRQSRIKIYQAGEMIYDSGKRATTPYPLAYGSYWNMVSLVCFIIALISLRKGKKRFQDRRLIHGIWILIVSTICEFIRFYLINNRLSGHYSDAGGKKTSCR